MSQLINRMRYCNDGQEVNKVQTYVRFVKVELSEVVRKSYLVLYACIGLSMEMKELKDGKVLQPSDMKRSETRLFLEAFKIVTYKYKMIES